MIQVFTDGGARGNPGPAAVGVYIETDKNEQLYGLGKPIGVATNNVAEYKAVIEALLWLSVKSETVRIHEGIIFSMDSLLIYSQIKGLYKIKNNTLQGLLREVHQLESRIHIPIFYQHIPREQNTKADMYVNQALDRKAIVSYNGRSI